MESEKLDVEAEKIGAGPSNGLKYMKELEEKLKNGLTKVEEPDKSDSNGQVIKGKLYDFAGKKGRMLKVGHDNVKIRNCKFRNNKGEPVLVIAKSENVVIEDCIFEDITAKNGENREPLRIGEDGRESGLSLNCIVRRCIFRNNSADDEIISIKSANNTIEDCFFINNDGNVTVRHGGLAKIRHNYFKGNNGVRIHGYGNRVEYNYFEDNDSASDDKDNMRCPISVWWGNDDYDPNWVPDTEEGEGASKPSKDYDKSKIGTHSVYARAVGTVIRGNEFRECENTIIESFQRKEGHDKEPLRTIREDITGN